MSDYIPRRYHANSEADRQTICIACGRALYEHEEGELVDCRRVAVSYAALQAALHHEEDTWSDDATPTHDSSQDITPPDYDSQYPDIPDISYDDVHELPPPTPPPTRKR